MLRTLKSVANLPILLTYILLVFSILCGGNLHVAGSFSLRHLSTFVFLIIAVINRRRIHLKDWALPLYLMYILVFCICNIINGEYECHSFWQSLFTYHLPCIGLALGLPALLRDLEHVKLFVWALIILYVINSLLSFFQYSNSELAWAIATNISSQAEEGTEAAQMYTEASDNLLGYAIVAGMFGFVVTNGYFLATYLPVITYRINKDGFVNKLIASAFLVFASAAIFITQQRMAFLSLLLYLFFFVWGGIDKKWRIPLIVIVVIGLSYYGLSNIEMGRLTTDTNNDTRMKIFNDFFDFMGKGYWIFGGNETYLKLYHKSQHNAFLGAWVLGGIFNFAVFVILYFKLLRDSLKKIIKLKRKKSNYSFTLSFSFAVIIFLMYSLTHSAGVQSGSPMFWLVYTMMCVSYSLERKVK